MRRDWRCSGNSFGGNARPQYGHPWEGFIWGCRDRHHQLGQGRRDVCVRQARSADARGLSRPFHHFLQRVRARGGEQAFKAAIKRLNSKQPTRHDNGP